MILCMCENVNEQEWAQALRAHGHDVLAAQQACGAGQCCGSCVSTLMEKARPLSVPVAIPALALVDVSI